MVENLLLEILQTLKRGNSTGAHTVREEVLKMQAFNEVNEAQYLEAWKILMANKCIVDFRNQQKNNVTEYKINPEKDCILTYSEKLKEKEKQLMGNAEREELLFQVNKLTLEGLQYEGTIRDLKKSLAEAQLNDIPKNAEDRKTLLTWQIVAGVSITIAFLLKLFGVKGWL